MAKFLDVGWEVWTLFERYLFVFLGGQVPMRILQVGHVDWI